MNKNAHAVLDKLDSMQTACDISTIKKRAEAVRSDQYEKGHSKEHHYCTDVYDILINMLYNLDQKRQHLFALAALIKSLADVPEQVMQCYVVC